MQLLTGIDLDKFESGSPAHLLAIAVCLLATVAACWLGLRWCDRPAVERRFRLAWAVFIIITQLFGTIWWLLPSNFAWRVSLPLHICDIVGVLAAVAMLVYQRLVWSVVYFWGIGLSIIAFIMPALDHGPAHVVFYLFWLTHLQVVGSATYLVVVRGFRPEGRDWLGAELLLALYCAIIFPLDAWLGLNYGYIGPVDSQASIMGPWPMRVAVMFLLQMVILGLLLLPWEAARRMARREPLADDQHHQR